MSFLTAIRHGIAMALVALSFPHLACAASADPDPTFNADGLVTHLQNAYGTGKIVVLNGITTQPDGKVLVVGEVDSTTGDGLFTSFIARFLADGALDSSFNGSGFRNHDIEALRDAAFEVLIQADGKILMGGHTTSDSGAPGNGNIFVARYHDDGSIDTDFGTAGIALINRASSDETLLGMALRNNGSIVLAGSSNTNGSIDSFFAQLTRNGDPDNNFGGGDGIVVHALSVGTIDNANGIDLYPNGKIAFTGMYGSSTSANTLVGRLNSDGSLDTGFAGVGYRVITNLNTSLRDFGDELMVLPNGDLVLSLTIDTAESNRASLGILKLSTTGEIDPDFGTSGLTLIAPEAGSNISIFNASELARQANGKILVVGAQASMDDNAAGGFLTETAKAVAARLNSDGTLDTSFDGDDGVIRQNFGITAVYPRASTVQSDGKLLMAGRARVLISGSDNYTSYMLARLSGDAIAVDTLPDAVSFTSVSDVTPNTIQTSATVTVAGVSDGVQVPLRISDGEYSIGGASFTADPGWVINGDQISVRHTASGLGNTSITTTLTIGGIASQFNGDTILGEKTTASFSSTTLPVDTVPNAFDFADQTDVLLDSWIISNTITVSDINFVTPISITNGEYSVGCTDSFTSTAGSISNGQSVCIRQRSAATVSTATATSLTIGSVSDTFTTTTASSIDITPAAFSFTDQTDVARIATITSNSITIGDINSPTAISVSGSGGYSIGCTGTFVNTPGTITNGQTVCLRHLAANAYSTTVTTTLTVGGMSDSFSSTTGAAPSEESGGGGGGGGSSSLMMLAVLLGLVGLGRKWQRCEETHSE